MKIGFVGLLQILFIGLKLTNHIDWGWLWVLAPTWVHVGVILGFCFVLAVIETMKESLER